MANKRVRSCNTLAYNGSVHPKKLEKLMQLRELSPFMPKGEEFHPENMSPHSEGERASPGTAHPGNGGVGGGASNGNDAINGYHSKGRSKRMLPARAVEILNKWYFDHLSYPYPTEEEKAEIARQGGLHVSQVTCWFANKRNRSHNTKKVKQQIFEYMAQKREQEEKGKLTGSEGHVTMRSPSGGDSIQSNIKVKVEMTL